MVEIEGFEPSKHVCSLRGLHKFRSDGKSIELCFELLSYQLDDPRIMFGAGDETRTRDLLLGMKARISVTIQN